MCMSLITRSTDYAVRAILYIAESKSDMVSTARLYEDLKLPRPFMRKIFQKLHKEGILISRKGNSGGFALAKSADDIFLSDIMKIFQGEFSFTECLLNKEVCPDIKTCPMRRKIKKIEKKVLKELEQINITSLLKRS